MDTGGRDWYEDYVLHVLAETLPQLRDSGVFVGFPPRTFSTPPQPGDIMFCTELGIALMLDKSIVFVVEPGTQLPKKLLRVADHVLEGEIATEEGRSSVTWRITAVLGRLDR